jgi:tetratricopeptide (TPR) repeat protein
VNTTQLLLTDHNKTIELNVDRMAIYLQSKIIEAYDQNQHVYYVFFYKDHYLTAAKATQIRRRSHIEHAFKEGIIFQSSHPLTQSLLASNQHYKKRTFSQLIKKFESIYTPQEMTLIATFFESFIPKKKLFMYIQNLFYEYRRNGKLFSSYRIIQILMDFCPNQTWVKEISNNLDFIKYSKLYQKQADILFEKDPIFIEKALFSQFEDMVRFQQLATLLEKQSRWNDLIAIYIYNISIFHNHDHYRSLIPLLEQHFQEEEVVEVLEDLSQQVPDMPDIQQFLLEKYLTLQKTDKVIHLMANHDLTLNQFQAKIFESMIQEFDFEPDDVQMERLISFIIPFFSVNPERAEKLLQKWIISLLKKDHDILSVKELFAPLNHTKEAAPLLRKIDKMHKLANDPDQQLLLGQLYYQFKQYDQAIECFSWEMELKSIDPKPVQWLSKIYNEMGMKQEYKAYQQLCIDMQKRA